MKLMNNIAKDKCKGNGVEFWNYYGKFVRYLMSDYIRLKKDIEFVESLDVHRLTYNDKYLLRNIFQNDFRMGIPMAKRKLDYKFRQVKKECFEWLSKTKEPYFFIYNPLYFKNNYYDTGYGTYLEESTGISKDSHILAKDYALHLMNYK